MDTLLVFASEDCIGWDELKQVLSRLRDREPETNIEIKCPIEYEEEFHERGLVICPSVIYDDELIAVGVPTLEELEEKIHD